MLSIVLFSLPLALACFWMAWQCRKVQRMGKAWGFASIGLLLLLASSLFSGWLYLLLSR